jgi:hypothetical protein
MISTWLCGRSKRKARVPQLSRRRPSVKLLLERFEERTVPAFLAPATYAAGTSPAGIVSADFQGAGGADIAVANIGSNNVSVYLNHNDGTGTFQSAVNYPAGSRPVTIAAADLNGDGLPDIVVANATSPATVTVLLNDPNNPGHFLAPVSLPTGGNTAIEVKLAQLTGDGFTDIIATNYGSNTVAVLLGNGDGTFQAAHTYAAGPGTIGAYSLAVADYYGDGFPSVAVGNFTPPNNGVVTILRDNGGDGTLQAYHQIATLPGFTSGLAAGDLGNGHQDLVSANNGIVSAGVSVLLNDGAGNFTVSTIATTQSAPLRITLGDVNGDGNLDMVVANFGTTPGNIGVFYGNGDGTFQAPLIVNSGGGQPAGVAVADVEGDSSVDSRNDIVACNFGSNNMAALLNTPAPIVVSTTLSGEHNGTVTGGDVVFSDPVDPATFTTDQAVIMDPNGNPVNVTDVSPTDGTYTHFHITFDPQSTVGAYTVDLGPSIMDATDTYTVPPFHSSFTVTNNLIVNGGFETGNFSGWTQFGDTSFTTVGSPPAIPVHSGMFAAQFGPLALGGISQTVATTPGQMYQLSLWLDHPFTDTGTEFRVRINGTTIDDQMNVGNIPYTQFTYMYMATGTSTTIELGFAEPPSYFYLDDVSFTPTGMTSIHGHAGAALTASGISASATALVQNQAPKFSRPALRAVSVQGQEPSLTTEANLVSASNLQGVALASNPIAQPASVDNVAQAVSSTYQVPTADVSDSLLDEVFQGLV